LCYNIFSACLTKRILPSKVNTSFSLLAYWHKGELALDFTFPTLGNWSQVLRHN
jgi:hypothetical protein